MEPKSYGLQKPPRSRTVANDLGLSSVESLSEEMLGPKSVHFIHFLYTSLLKLEVLCCSGE